jgi:bifunctional non-homologous end joining protein LigD
VANLSVSPLYTDGAALLDVTRRRGLAGVVAKRRGGTYRPGVRSPDWVVTTHLRTAACAVGGWRPARGAPERVDSLLLGLPDGGGLRFVGSVLAAQAGPVAQRVLQGRLVATPVPPFTTGLSRALAAGARWCEPATVVEVAHGGRGPGGRLRDPAFRGIRDDLHLSDLPPDLPPDPPADPPDGAPHPAR